MDLLEYEYIRKICLNSKFLRNGKKQGIVYGWTNPILRQGYICEILKLNLGNVLVKKNVMTQNKEMLR